MNSLMQLPKETSRGSCNAFTEQAAVGILKDRAQLPLDGLKDLCWKKGGAALPQFQQVDDLTLCPHTDKCGCHLASGYLV